MDLVRRLFTTLRDAVTSLYQGIRRGDDETDQGHRATRQDDTYDGIDDPYYNKYRQQAGKHAKLRNNYFEMSRKEYERGNKAMASTYSEMGHKEDELMKEANKKAGKYTFEKKNPNLKHSTEIDLHGLHADEIEGKLDPFLSNKLKEKRRTVLVIIGRGSHSADGVGTIRKAVTSYLENNHIRFAEHQRGALTVELHSIDTRVTRFNNS